MTKPCYDCGKCPAYCCSYPEIEVSKADIARLARHFGLTEAAAKERFTKLQREENVRILRHRDDEHFTSVCMFLDRKTRRCTVYEARPHTCRSYPYGARCGYYEFLKFEREHQDDDKFIAVT
ncbi:MAG TPA: YkgJ family cysteine cluster protein [Burkholderiales bacterium]|nr:YkgJ family cysteine cluster protein [Burkholderiales bacterium]